MSIPNLCSRRPVEMYGWVTAFTSGLTRMAIDAVRFSETAIFEMVSISYSDSQLKLRIPFSRAKRISAAVLPTPEKPTLAGSPPAASPRKSFYRLRSGWQSHFWNTHKRECRALRQAKRDRHPRKTEFHCGNGKDRCTSTLEYPERHNRLIVGERRGPAKCVDIFKDF